MSTILQQRWASRDHVGVARPVQHVYVRTGRFARGYTRWPTDKGNPMSVRAQIYKEKASKPWTATWTPDSAWVELPNINHVELTQDFENNGITVATISLDNVIMAEGHGPFGDVYHLIQRGYLSPWRGGGKPYRYPTLPANEWYGKLTRNAQIKVVQGYGADALVTTFTGLIDDCDVDSHPDLITLTVRDFGQTLVDQHVFGWCISPQLPEPTIFRSLGVGADGSVGKGIGYGAKASSSRKGHPARFITDHDINSRWISTDHTIDGVTEWVQVRVPRGRYESIAVHIGYPGMCMYLGVFARSGGLGGRSAQVDDENIEDGWITPDLLADSNGGAAVPGANGGWPYIKFYGSIDDKAHSLPLGAKLDLGDDSVFRLGFRNLKYITHQTYRASVERAAPVKRSDPTPIRLRPVGTDPKASSTRPHDGTTNYHAANVIDNHRHTRWLSIDHTIPGVTEWVQIRLEQAQYSSLRLDPAYPGMDVYIGVFARQGKKKKKCSVDGNYVDDGWIDTGLGDVPGANGGWPFIKFIPNLDRPQNPAKIGLGHKLELGSDSVIRVAFRGLQYVSHEKYRAGVSRLMALTPTGLKQPDDDPKDKVVAVGDLSDVVKVVLRWAGFKEWDIEPVGAPLAGKWRFNRGDTLMDVIKKAQDATGYVFYINEPSADDRSLGIPVFRSNAAIVDPPGGMAEIRDTDMISRIDAKATDEPLKYIIRVRGNKNKRGATLGADKTRRLMAVYRPPWTRANKLAGLIKHVSHTEKRLLTKTQCMVMAQLIALQEALVAAACEVTVPGMPDFQLNEQIGLVDTGTGLNTRLFIARRSTTFLAGAQTTWETTLGGALIDTDDIQGVIADLRATLASMGLDPQKINLGDPFRIGKP
jgi:hypothetical protein